MDFKNFFNEIYEALVISKCPGCREIVRYSGTLCPECLEKYKEEIEIACPYCGMTAEKCVCNTRNLRPHRKLQKSIYSYLFYSGQCPASRKLIFALKDSPDRNAEKFFASELAPRILKILEESGDSAENWHITFPPRTEKSVKKFGFDQAKGMAKRISKQTGLTYAELFTHSGKAVQKQLDRKNRMKNAGKSFLLKKDANVKGKKYIIVDDIITSGATMKRCQNLLLNAGAKSAFPVSIAKTVSRGEGFDKAERKTSRKKLL